MILRKDYVKIIKEGKAQVEVEKTEEHNKMLNIIFPYRHKLQSDGEASTMSRYFWLDHDDKKYGYSCSSNFICTLPIIQASDIILDNTVIKVESEEHGKKVIEWWKEQGAINKINLLGNSNNYYGVHYRNIRMFYQEEIESKKIITLPETFPSKWYLKITDSNKEVANEWRRSVAKSHQHMGLATNNLLLSKHHDDSSCGFFNTYTYFKSNYFNEYYSDYLELTTEQFLEHIYKPFKAKQKVSKIVSEVVKEKIKQENKMRTITYQQGQEIINIACQDWKKELAKIWGQNIVLRIEIKVEQEFYQRMRKACTKEQHELFDKIFGKEKEEINLWSGAGLDGYDLFNKGLNDDDRFLISILGGYGDSFYLHNGFKWVLDGNILKVEHK
jgi:hypothetical protein